MSNARFHKDHWKELIASAREKNAEQTDQGKGEESDGSTTPEKHPSQGARWATAGRLYREYFQRYRYVWLGVSLVVLTACLGMALAPDDRPNRVPVSGQVLLDDKPLTNAMIVLIPREGRSAVASLDEQGRFTLSCFGGEDGAIPGNYGIEIAMTKAPRKTDPPWPVPKMYTQHMTSGLSAEITKSTRDLVIRLTSETEEPPAQSPGDRAPPRADGK